MALIAVNSPSAGILDNVGERSSSNRQSLRKFARLLLLRFSCLIMIMLGFHYETGHEFSLDTVAWNWFCCSVGRLPSFHLLQLVQLGFFVWHLMCLGCHTGLWLCWNSLFWYLFCWTCWFCFIWEAFGQSFLALIYLGIRCFGERKQCTLYRRCSICPFGSNSLETWGV